MTLEVGKKYTLFGIGEMLPACFRMEFTVKDMYDNKPVIVNKGKRKRFYLRPIDNALVIEGWDIKPLLTPEVVVNGCRSFSMNGRINFATDNAEEIINLVKRNLNETFTAYNDIMIVSKNNEKLLLSYDDIPMEFIQKAGRRKR